MTKNLPAQLWTPRSQEETVKLYADWAENYEADVAAYGYATPGRVAKMLAAHLPEPSAPILDFGCGTGLSGKALADAGFTTLDGTDASAEMLIRAEAKGLYRALFKANLGGVSDAIRPGTYAAITAVGAISLGAAPAALLTPLLDRLGQGGLLVFSYNDATLIDPAYMQVICDLQVKGHARVLAADYGPHLPQKEGARGSTVYVLERL